MKTLILYTTHEIDENTLYFIENGIFEHPDYKFVLIINHPNPILPELPKSVDIVFRENRGFDFGAWSQVVLCPAYVVYDYYLFINSSCLGPMLPTYYKGIWCDIFTSLLNDQVKLSGATVNVWYCPEKNAHVQSYLFAMSKDTLVFMVQRGIFRNDYQTKEETLESEQRMSRLLIDAGYNIASVAKVYDGVDFCAKSFPSHMYAHGDLTYHSFFHPYDVVFLKMRKRNNSFHMVHLTGNKKF